jgi:hypothetical protein
MPTALGQTSWIGFADESVYGTYVAATKFLRPASIGLKGEQSRKVKELLGQPSISTSFASVKKVSGSIKVPGYITGLEKLFKHAIGGVVDAGAGPYTHTYSPAAALPVGLSFHVNRDSASLTGSSAFKYFGCQISKLSFSQGVDDLLEVALDIAGQDWGNLAVETPTFPADTFFDYAGLVVNVGGSPWVVKGFDLELDNNLATDRHQLGSRIVRGMGRKGPRRISGKISKEFESLTEYQTFLNLTNVAIVATWTSGTASLAITLPKCYFKGEDPGVSDSGPIETSMEFEAHKNSADNDELSMVLTNATALGT